ncbi:MarR family winged helix-turn-helix transcriptional regulator [Kitasatospora sp. RG8]|uniref:MarR family winged helix-turn-helix transcriptional regulator n=1 Tax=Kitasatospora sp. RG8 TaxID=2820815 RepID=UPI001FD82221|nr:MarR family transcriptional regulator [Kitasatospora sp. RG8]
MSPSPPVPDPAAGPQREAAERPDPAPRTDLAPQADPAPRTDLALPAIERARRLTDVVTRLRRALRSSIRTDYPWESLPMAQVELLQSLAAAPLRVGELAARQRLAPNTVSGLVGKLLEAGFVDRQADPGDRRTARIALTPAGRRQLDDWQRAHERRIAAALGTLSPADREAVMLALPALDNLARALARPAAPE